MSKKFKDIVNAPHEFFGKQRQKIQKKKPKTTEGKIKKAAGVAGTGAAQFILWLSKYITLDNHAIRALEDLFADMKVGKNKAGQQKKVSSFMKKYPDLSAHIIYYMMLAGIAGGAVAVDKHDEIVEAIKSRFEKIDMKPQSQFEPGTYGAYRERLSSVTPYLIIDLIVKEGVRVNDQGLHIPYQDEKGVWTIGFGSTRLKDGTSVTRNTPPITTEEAYELSRWHLEDHESFFVMYCYDVALDSVDVSKARQVIALGSAMYNTYSDIVENASNGNHQKRMALLRQDFAELGYGITDEQVRQRFAQYPVVSETSFGEMWLHGGSDKDVANKFGSFMKEGGGIIWRRWLEAGMMMGEITPQMLLDCPIGGMYEFYVYKGRKKSAFWKGTGSNKTVNTATFKEFRQWLKNPVNKKEQSLAHWKKVRDYLPADVLEKCLNGQCELGAQQERKTQRQRRQQEQIEIQTYVVGYDAAYDAAIELYNAGKFKKAAKAFEELVEQYPDNALLRNDLADTYNKLERYDDAIAQAREVVRRIGDKSQYGAAQYNAGYAYEQKGDLQKALANYKLAVANGNRKVQKDVTRVSNKLHNQARGKRTSFNAGKNKIKNAVDARGQGVQTFYMDDRQKA